MGTFNITQTPISKDLYIYPDANDTVQLTPIGVANNYDCVNDTVGAGDDDTTYVYTANVSAVSDLYTLTDHATETGAINSITLYTKCKSHIYNPASSATYELLLGIKDASAAYYTYYKSSETSYGTKISPTTDYQIFSCLWTSNPSTQNNFTWTDTDNLRMGIRCSSPLTGGSPLQFVLYPNAVGDLTELTAAGGTNYSNVDDPMGSPDEDTTYNYSNGVTGIVKVDLYNVPNHTTETGPIDNVTVYTRAKTVMDYATQFGYEAIKVWGTGDYGTVHDLTGGYVDYSTIWTSKPSDSTTWTWSDIDNLQIGFKAYQFYDASHIFLTQCYGIVNYRQSISPEIRTTQCFAKINYNPGSSTCTLFKPENYSISHRRDVKKINTWNNSRYVYDCGRLGKTLNMNGLQYNTISSEASVALSCVKTMKDNGVKVTLSGFNDDNVNGDWFIRNLSFEKQLPNMYNWNMELEKA